MEREAHPHEPARQANQFPTDNSNPPRLTFKGPRARRFIAALVAGETSTFDLLHVVGAMNIWDLCAQLRRQGWNIRTRQKSITDRDGRKASVGFYSLDPKQIPIALEALSGAREGDHHD